MSAKLWNETRLWCMQSQKRWQPQKYNNIQDVFENEKESIHFAVFF